MNAKKSFHYLFGLALVIALFSSSANSSQASSGGTLIDTPENQVLYDKALADGTVRLIVGLDIGKEFVPEGNLTSEEVQTQRLAIQQASNSVITAVAGYETVVNATYQYVPYIALSVDAPGLHHLATLTSVASLHEDKLSKPTLSSSTLVIGAPTVWEGGYTGSGWTVAVLDTGSQWDHPFLVGRVVSETCYSYHTANHFQESLCPDGWNVDTQTTGHAADPTTALCWNGAVNICDHGSHVTGIAAGNGASGSVAPYNGVAPDANIIAIQIFTRFNRDTDCGGTGYAPCVMSYDSDQMLGLERVYSLRSTYNIASVNMSLGGGGPYNSYCDTDPLKASIDNLLSAEIATIIATGNDGFTTGISAPACISSAIAVGATTDLDTVADFSNSGNLVELLAPGVSIDSSVPDSTYANFNGTSMATPHVAGAWAVLKSVDPSATVAQILSRLQSTGVSVTDSRNGITRPRIQLDAAARTTLPTLTWTGDISTAWDNTGNWSTATLPTSLNSVTIPASPSGGRFPSLSTTGNVYDLNIDTGAEMYMTAGTLNVYSDFAVGSGGFLDATGGTVIFQGTDDQTITMPDDANNQLYNIQIGDGSTQQQVVLGSNLDINGNLTIQGGNNLQPGAYTLSVAGNWVDAEGGFLPGTSTVIFDGDSEQIVQINASQLSLVNEDFSAYDDLAYSWFSYDGPTGWVVENTSGNNYPWFFTGWARLPNTVLNGHIRHYPTVTNATTWVFTPAMNLFDGLSYQLQFDNGVYSNSRFLRVALGSAQNSASMTTVLQDYTVTNTSWQTRSIIFTVPSDGVYYLGFRATNGSNTGDGQGLDDISVTAIPKLLFYNLTIDTVDTNLILGDDLLVKNDLVVNNGGQLNLSTYNLNVEGTLTNNGTMIQQMNAGSGSLTRFLNITNAAGSTDKYFGVDITPSGEMGLTTVTIRGNQTACNQNDQLIHRCFDITPGTNQNATVRFWYLNSESGSEVPAAMNAYHWDNPGWSQLDTGGEIRGTVGDYEYVEVDNVSAYSPFGLSDGSPDAPTAVTVAGFAVLPDLNQMRITWEVIWEVDVSGFNLYRSESATGQRILLGYIPLQPANTLYEFFDGNIIGGKDYYYWLEVIGSDSQPEEYLGPVSTRSNILFWLPTVQR